MDDNLDQNDFEAFLRDQLRTQKMYPDENVWKDINRKLHGEKKWPALTVAALLLLCSTVAICIHFKPEKNLFVLPQSASATLQSRPLPNNSFNPSGSGVSPTFNDFNSGGSKPLSQSKPIVSTGEHAISSNLPDQNARVTTIETAFDNESRDLTTSGNLPVPHHKSMVQENGQQKLVVNSGMPDEYPFPDTTKIAKATNNATGTKKAVTKVDNDKNVVDQFLSEHQNDVAIHTKPAVRLMKGKFSYEIYIAPSVSYRSLVEDRSLLKDNSNGPLGLNYVADVNNVVRHKPNAGFEAGISFKYNVTERFKVKAGVQFNMRQYNIEAFRSQAELASIALVDRNRIDTVNTLAIYRNNNGYNNANLVNRYFQLSVPLGVEYQILGNSKVQWDVAASIQPTYLINRNAYLLTTNFKNYTESPDMIRRWNLNSNIETFLSVNVGTVSWKFGPQLRYQPYSTFIRQYPIKEHLMDYGFKIGLTKTIR